MMTTSTQESQVFVGKELHTKEQEVTETIPSVPQDVEMEEAVKPMTAPVPSNGLSSSAPLAAAVTDTSNVRVFDSMTDTTSTAQSAVPTGAEVPEMPSPTAAPPVTTPAPHAAAPPVATPAATVVKEEVTAVAQNVPSSNVMDTADSNPKESDTGQNSVDVKPVIETATESMQGTLVQHELEKLIIQEQFKFASNIVKQLKKRKEGFLFSNPVDPVQLNIPTYFDVIESPMDLSTVEKKLSSQSYKSPNEVKEDIILMFNNCYKFNGMEAQVSKMGMDLQKYFEKEWEKLPKELKEKKKKSSRPISNQTHGEGVHRPRREVTSIPREPTVSEVKASSGRKLTPQLKFASSLLRDLMKKHYNPYNLAFLVPVDPDALGIPQYRDIIKNPMDLSTMRKKMDAGHYKDGDEFEADVRLMFRNCYTFNAPGSEVYNLGKELEAVFDRKWADKPAPGDYIEDKNRRSSQPGVYHSAVYLDEEDSGDDDADAQHIEMLKTQVQLLTTQLTLLTEKRARKKKARAQAAMIPKKSKHRPKSMPGGVEFSQSKPMSGKRSLDIDSEVVQELTYDQKRELSENINILTQDQLGRVLQIIRENTHIDESQGEEIELDIDSLDKVTLWKLYTFVTKHTQKQKRARLDGRADSSSGSETGSDSEDSGSGSD